MSDVETEFHKRWLGMVEPVEGLVVSVPVLTDAQCMVRQPPELQRRLADDELGLTMRLPPARDGRARRVIPDLGRFLGEVLHLGPAMFDRGDALPADLSLYVPEGKETLRPTIGLRKKRVDPAPGADEAPAIRAGAGYVMLVLDLPGVPLDAPDAREGAWRYPPVAKFDRLLRACRVPLGLITNREEFRLVYAPHGESTGVMTFRVGDLASTGGREILDAFVMLLSAHRFFGAAPDRQLPELCRRSRLHQANVTNELAEQVLDALQILLRGFEDAAARDGSGGLAEAYDRSGDHLYGGLLTVLLRLVFLLYAEDTGLLPTRHPHYAQHLSVLGLFDRLQADQAAFPDTMARRFGAWPRLCALFRAVYLGVRRRGDPDVAGFAEDLVLPARRGQLFDPEEYPFLEGWPAAGGAPVAGEDRAAVRVPTIDDGTVYRVLERLVLHRGQRLSYRALDVEQIGSVYEALMGYHVLRLPAAAVCLRPERVWVTADEVLDQAPTGARRAAWLEEHAGVPKNALAKIGKAIEAAKSEDEVLRLLEAQQVKGGERAGGGRYVIQPGPERRRTSSHYTPRSLSAPIVQRTLEPLLLAMGERPSSERLLELKVCDPAMGSGAFLVEACRFLADQVVAAWTREGVSTGVEDPVLRARRLVAQRCLYGVDKNPFAVNLAKLSLWLVTLAKDEPFTFVDHALRHGDSLVGLSFDQIRAFHWAAEAQLELFKDEVNGALDEAVGLRQRILDLARVDGEDKTKEKEHLLWDAEDALDRVRLIGDLIVGAFFAHEKDKDRKVERNRRLDLVTAWLRSGEPAPAELLEMQADIRHRIPTFHWMIEFPEIFYAERPDPLDEGRTNRAAYMDAFIGNPPFADKNAVSAANGEVYIRWLQAVHEGTHGNSDISAHFFRLAGRLLGSHGCMGLLATNTIAQGDTRTTGLKALLYGGFSIYTAIPSMKWPGAANVAVSVVHLSVGRPSEAQHALLDGVPVASINSRLRAGHEREDAARLEVNRPLWYQGAKVYGVGFQLTPSEREELVRVDPRNAEVIFPYIGGEEINSDPQQRFSRYVINFGQLQENEAASWKEPFRIVVERVRPERDGARDDTADGAHRKKYWWQFAQPRPELFAAIRPLRRVLVAPRVSKHLVFLFQETDRVFSEQVNIFVFNTYVAFVVLQSRVHEPWARLISSSMRTDLRYSASDCFETFPFPKPDPRAVIPELEAIGERLYTARADYMKQNQVGLTITYNRLKDPENTEPAIVELRRLHEEMDRAVLAAYGWSDVAVPPYGTPRTPDEKKALEAFEDEVIDRLFALNTERAAEEKRLGATVGAKQKGAGKGKAAAKKGKAKKGAEQQLGLLGDEGEEG